jgi:hypothetical protein
VSWKCPECHLDYGELHPPIAINTIKSLPRRFGEAIADQPDEDTDAVIRTRPAQGVWSALEYTAHVADLLPLFAKTIERMNTQTNPDLGDLWSVDPDEQATSADYNGQARDAVLGNLRTGADELLAVAESVDASAWSRTGTFPWGERDMLTMLQNAAHEGVHHLKDVEKGLAQLRG